MFEELLTLSGEELFSLLIFAVMAVHFSVRTVRNALRRSDRRDNDWYSFFSRSNLTG